MGLAVNIFSRRFHVLFFSVFVCLQIEYLAVLDSQRDEDWGKGSPTALRFEAKRN